jgi:hypothetical protein
MMRNAISICVVAASLAACGPAQLRHDAAVGDDANVPTCTPNATDQEGCSCTPGTSRACYPNDVDPGTRNVGACHDGMQACNASGEFGIYGPCTGAATPMPENCTNGIDDNCDGKIDCADPTCATNAACRTGCTDGQTRPCYDGPSGTENVGICMDGTQTCANGMWPANCPGEVLPQPQDCTSPIDKACNHLPGCFNIFVCSTNPACMQHCMVTNPMCVCPTGNGDTATCPDGTHGVSNGLFPPTVECCPCTANDCGDANCCADAVCAGNAACSGVTCKPLPPSCNGQVSFDCDDFPEDCDEPCCKCSMCP